MYKGGAFNSTQNMSRINPYVLVTADRRVWLIFQGSPVFLDSYACGVNFDWYTTAACKTAPTASEVKCYVYNDHGQKIDLSPLIKTHGAHRVTYFKDELYINVCRDITKCKYNNDVSYDV